MHIFEVDRYMVSSVINTPNNEICVKIRIIDFDSTYTTEINDSDLKLQHSMIPMMSYHDYILNALSAFKGELGSVITIRASVLTFKWYIEATQGIKLNLGSIVIQRDKNSQLITFIRDCKAYQDVLVANAEENRAEIILLGSRNDILLSKYNEYIKKREESDSILFKRFKEVLNEKKVKIKALSG